MKDPIFAEKVPIELKEIEKIEQDFNYPEENNGVEMNLMGYIPKPGDQEKILLLRMLSWAAIIKPHHEWRRI